MGLDWNPANKPLPGREMEYWRLFEELPNTSGPEAEEKQARFEAISQSAFETLVAPQVGIDAVATQWARQKHSENKIDTPVEEWLEALRGLYIVPLASPCDVCRGIRMVRFRGTSNHSRFALSS